MNPLPPDALLLIDSGPMDPALSMAADEVLARRVSRGERGDTLHIYRRSCPAVSVGFSRRVDDDVDKEACRREGVLVLRRISGGGTIYTDGGVLEYGIVSRQLAGRSVRELFALLCGVIAGTIRDLGLDAVHKPPNDILVDGCKVSGSAQNRKGGTVLQHGTFVVDANLRKAAAVMRGATLTEGGTEVVFAADPPRRLSSLRLLSGRDITCDEVRDAFLEKLAGRFGWEYVRDAWTGEEREEMEALVAGKFGLDEWNLKR